MDSFSRGELRFPVRDHGDGHSGTVALLHGFPQQPDSWDAVVPPLVDAGYRVLVPTLRGYAETNRPQGLPAYTVDVLVGDVEALVEAAGDGPLHLVGHDWGAVIAWAVAESRPDLLRTVTGLSVPPRAAFAKGLQSPRQLLASWYVLAVQLPRLPELLAASPLGRRGLVSALVASGQLQSRAERDVAALLDPPGGLTAALAYYRALRLGGTVAARPITTPALYVWSNRDTAITSAVARLAGKTCQGPYRAATLVGVSHWIPEAAPEALTELLIPHLAAAPQEPAAPQTEAGRGVI